MAPPRTAPRQALEVAQSEGGFSGVQEGLLVAKEEDDRVLYVVEVDGVVKQAVIVHDGPATEGRRRSRLVRRVVGALRLLRASPRVHRLDRAAGLDWPRRESGAHHDHRVLDRT